VGDSARCLELNNNINLETPPPSSKVGITCSVHDKPGMAPYVPTHHHIYDDDDDDDVATIVSSTPKDS
jgi:hypothetical protein